MKEKILSVLALMLTVALIFSACSQGSTVSSEANSASSAISEDTSSSETADSSIAEVAPEPVEVAADGYTWVIEPFLEADSVTLIDPYSYGDYDMWPFGSGDEAITYTSADYHGLYLVKQGDKTMIYKMSDESVSETIDMPDGFSWDDNCGICNSDWSAKYSPVDFSTTAHGGHGGTYDNIQISIYDSGTESFYPGELEQEAGKAYIYKYSNVVENGDNALIGPEAAGDENGFCVIKDGKLISELFADAKPNTDIVTAGYSYVLPITLEEGSAWPVMLADGTWTMVDSEGKISGSYEDAKIYHDKYAAVKSNGKWGIIDNEGNQLVDFILSDITSIDNKRAFAKSEDGTWGYIWIAE